jgi:hypothetical protein
MAATEHTSAFGIRTVAHKRLRWVGGCLHFQRIGSGSKQPMTAQRTQATARTICPEHLNERNFARVSGKR